MSAEVVMHDRVGPVLDRTRLRMAAGVPPAAERIGEGGGIAGYQLERLREERRHVVGAATWEGHDPTAARERFEDDISERLGAHRGHDDESGAPEDAVKGGVLWK